MTDFYIAPNGSGSGNSIDDPAGINSLASAIGSVGPGGHVYLIADRGIYRPTSHITISNGGEPASPVTITGISSTGDPMNAEFIGTRADPWSNGEANGNELFRLLNGADNLTFSNIEASGFGYGVFRVGADISNLILEHIEATNVERFFVDQASGSNATATISGLTLRDVMIEGFSKRAIELDYDSHDILIEDVHADSQYIDGNDYTIGVHLTGTVHDVVFNRVWMSNAIDVRPGYDNGDGFATERDVYNVEFRDTYASGNRDGGYDVKSTNTVFLRAIADGNSHNFRIWSDDAVLHDVISIEPRPIQGQTATHLYHFDFEKYAHGDLINPYVYSTDTSSIVHYMPNNYGSATIQGARLMVAEGTQRWLSSQGSTISTSDNAEIMTLGLGSGYDGSASTANLNLKATDTGQFLIGGSGDDMLGGGAGMDLLVGGIGDDVLIGAGGDDLLIGGDGSDVMLGGAGYDMASYAGNSQGVTVDLDLGYGFSATDIDLLFSIEAVEGSAFSDTLIGSVKSDLLLGNAGDDILDGGTGNDELIGGAGADQLLGGDGNDIANYSESAEGVHVDLAVNFGLGGDAEGDTYSSIEIVIGSAFGDRLVASSRGTTLIGGMGADQLIGGDGIDTVDYGNSAQGVEVDLLAGIGGAGDALGDTFLNIDFVVGSVFDDRLVGDQAANHLFGMAGNDILDGGDGDDLLIGGEGADHLIGGEGIDTVSYQGNTEGIIVDLTAGTAAGGMADGDTLESIERVLGSGFDDIIDGDEADNELFGGAGDDRLSGGDGADLLDGGEGFDTVDYSRNLAGVIVDFAGNNATGDRFVSIEAAIGSRFNDQMTAGSFLHFIDGADGDDELFGRSALDVLVGGAGADRFSGNNLALVDYSNATGGVEINLEAGTGSGHEAEGDSFEAVTRLVGSAYDDLFVGSAMDDEFVSSLGADAMDGRGGIDTIDYSRSDTGIVLDLNGTGIGGDAEGDTFASIERIIGTSFDDTIIGDDANNIFIGGAGADEMDGGSGVDTVDYSRGDQGVTIDLTTGRAMGGDAEGDSLRSIEIVFGTAFDDRIVGDDADNHLFGLAGNDDLDGGSGDDEMIGGTGNDVYKVDSVGDIVVEMADEGADRVLTSLPYYELPDNVEYFNFIGTGDFVGIANNLDNRLVGGDGSETFYARGGDDTFYKSAGADTYYGGDGIDTGTYVDSAAITINLTTQVNHGGYAEGDQIYETEIIIATSQNDSLTGDENDNIFYARHGNDVIYGMGGNDLLNGGPGRDTMFGGTGDDVYYVDSVSDQIVEYVNEGLDRVWVELGSYTLPDNFEELRADRAVSFVGTGNALDNLIQGHTRNDILFGMDGDDILIGRAGADQLFGGTGTDSASYASSSIAVSVNLATGTAMGGDAEGDTFDSVENLIGSAYDDILIGNDVANRIDAGFGDDFIDGGKGNDILAGGKGADIFYIDALNIIDRDIILDFGSNDSLLLNRAIHDGNGDGNIVFSNNRMRVDGNDNGAVINFENVAPNFALRYLGADADGHHYGQLSVRPEFVTGYTVREGKITSDNMTAVSGTAELFFFDNATSSPLGVDQITGFGSEDIVVTTAKLSNTAEGGLFFAENGSFQLGESAAFSILPDSAVGSSRIEKLEYDGQVFQDGSYYYFYSLEGSPAGKPGDAPSQSQDTIIGDAGDNLLAGTIFDDRFVGGGGRDVFALYLSGDYSHDTIADFGADDALRTSRQIHDGNGDGNIVFSGTRLRIDGNDKGPSVSFENVNAGFAMRYLGFNADGHYYAQLSVRPDFVSEYAVREGSVKSNNLSAVTGSAELFFFDNGGAAPTGTDAISRFGTEDVIVTTAKLAALAPGEQLFAEDGFFNLGNGDSLAVKQAVGTGDVAIGTLEYDGHIYSQGVTYYFYSLEGSQAGVPEGYPAVAADIIVGDEGDNVLVGTPQNDIFVGGGGSDTFVIDTAKDVVHDAIRDFGTDDFLLVSQMIHDGNGDGIIRFSGDRVRLDGTDDGDILTLQGVSESFDLFYWGHTEGGHLYGGGLPGNDHLL